MVGEGGASAGRSEARGRVWQVRSGRERSETMRAVDSMFQLVLSIVDENSLNAGLEGTEQAA